MEKITPRQSWPERDWPHCIGRRNDTPPRFPCWHTIWSFASESSVPATTTPSKRGSSSPGVHGNPAARTTRCRCSNRSSTTMSGCAAPGTTTPFLCAGSCLTSTPNSSCSRRRLISASICSRTEMSVHRHRGVSQLRELDDLDAILPQLLDADAGSSKSASKVIPVRPRRSGWRSTPWYVPVNGRTSRSSSVEPEPGPTGLHDHTERVGASR